MPDISVIVPIYNMENYLHKCVDSIICQNYKSLEILLINGSSTDGSSAICDELAALDGRIHVLHQPNKGVSAARNMGIENAKSEFVTFIDADDYILPDMFTTMYMEITRQNMDILCCGSRKDTGGQPIEDMDYYATFEKEFFSVSKENQREYMYKLALNGRTMTVWAKLYRRDFLITNNLRFQPEAYSEDFVFNVRCFICAKRVGTINQSFYIYYDRPGSRIYSSNLSEIENSAKILWELYRGYEGAGAEDVKAYAAARIISSTLFNLKLKGMSIESVCDFTFGIIQKLSMEPYLLRAGEDSSFCEYAGTVGMNDQAAENYKLFIQSLQSLETMLTWQKRYAEIEKDTSRWKR